MDDPEVFQIFNLADHHDGWTVETVLGLSLPEYEGWWEYHRRNGDIDQDRKE